MKISNPSNIRYLVFQGGGGRGFAYVGAVKALEDRRVLPTSRGKVRGIAGASAGSIIGLLLSMGLSLEEILNEVLYANVFKDFYEEPRVGHFRGVVQNKPIDLVLQKESVKLGSFLSDLAAHNQWLTKKLAENVPEGSTARFYLDKFSESFLTVLLTDFGVFSGLKARSVIGGLINRFVRRLAGLDGQTVGFEAFAKATGINFVVTGTNLTTRSPGIFSARTTPDFPVAEAVGISMSLPGAFKPVHVGQSARGYDGLWIDGGVLNNFPLHVFDDEPGGSAARSLHPGVLAFRLLDANEPSGHEVPKFGGAGGIETIGDYLGAFFATLLYPSASGQILSRTDLDQVIDIDPRPLFLVEFAPSQSDLAKPATRAQAAVEKYFNG